MVSPVDLILEKLASIVYRFQVFDIPESCNVKIVNDLQDKPEGLDVSVLPIGSVSGLPVALHPYG